MPFPTFHTTRLLLRALMPQDEPEIFELRSNAATNRFVNRPKAQSLEDARRFISQITERVERDETLYWAITLKTDPRLIGTILFWNMEPASHKAEIGFELLPEYQGQGLMQEALAKVIEYGFTAMQLQTIEAISHIDNSSSIKLLERNHFIPQPLLQEEPDTVTYRLHKA